MRLKLAAARNDVIYAVKSTGQLIRYEYTPAGLSSPRVISETGWGDYIHLVAEELGVIYAVRSNGDLTWHRLNGSTWAAGSGTVIGTGWNQFSHVLQGGLGVLYGVRPTGEIRWYKDQSWSSATPRAGASRWAPGSGNQIGEGFNQFRHVFSGINGRIYGITHAGDLVWYRDLWQNGRNNPNGSTGWDSLSGRRTLGPQVWNQMTWAISGGGGVIYGFKVSSGNSVYRFHDTEDSDSTDEPVSPEIENLSLDQLAPLEGYAWPLSGAPSTVIDFKVSSVLPLDYTVTHVRLGSHIENTPAGDGSLMETEVRPPVRVAGRFQSSTDNAWRDGCNWATSFSLTIPRSWPSGYYAAKCVSPTGYVCYLPYIVKPYATRRANFLVVANVNTWNSYNEWGGHSNYTVDYVANRPQAFSFLRPDPLLLNVRQDHWRGNHLLRGELWMFEWLKSLPYTFDVATDIDFHMGTPSLSRYKGIILHTHPEYWSIRMMENLKRYLANGGCLLYLGGNGIYRVVEYEETERGEKPGHFVTSTLPAQMFRAYPGATGERALLGVAHDGRMPFSQYQARRRDPSVRADRSRLDGDPSHWLLRGTNIRAGESFGSPSFFGNPASGWEIDDASWYTSAPGDQAPGNIEIIAGNESEPTTNMVYYQTLHANRFVFSVGSITFGGSLVKDPRLQKIVRNALAKCMS